MCYNFYYRSTEMANWLHESNEASGRPWVNSSFGVFKCLPMPCVYRFYKTYLIFITAFYSTCRQGSAIEVCIEVQVLMTKEIHIKLHVHVKTTNRLTCSFESSSVDRERESFMSTPKIIKMPWSWSSATWMLNTFNYQSGFTQKLHCCYVRLVNKCLVK